MVNINLGDRNSVINLKSNECKRIYDSLIGRPILHYEAKNKKSWLFKSFLFIPRKRFSKKKNFFLAGTGRSEAIYFAL